LTINLIEEVIIVEAPVVIGGDLVVESEPQCYPRVVYDVAMVSMLLLAIRVATGVFMLVLPSVMFAELTTEVAQYFLTSSESQRGLR